MLREEGRISLYRRLLVCTNVGLVVVEVNVLYILIEQVLIGNRRN